MVGGVILEDSVDGDLEFEVAVLRNISLVWRLAKDNRSGYENHGCVSYILIYKAQYLKLIRRGV